MKKVDTQSSDTQKLIYQDNIDSKEGEADKTNAELLNDVQICFEEPIIKPPKALTISDRIVGTHGNFMLLIGKAKSRKTFLVVMAVAATVGENPISEIQGWLPNKKPMVLYFDTEQGKYHVQKIAERISKLTNSPNPENLIIYHLRKYKPSKRLELIEEAIYNRDDIGMVIIDGARDIVTSINDEEQATEISSKFLKWTEEREFHLITVLHQNKNDNNARGHLGTELINKAESTLTITKDDKDREVSIVEAAFCRDIDPDPFAFEINSEGLPIQVDDWKARVKPTNKLEAYDLTPLQQHDIIKEVFSHGDSFGHGGLVDQVKLAFKKIHDKNLGTNKAKEMITNFKNERSIIQPKGPHKPYEINIKASEQ